MLDFRVLLECKDDRVLRRRLGLLVSKLGIRPRLSLVVLVAIAPLFALLLSGAIADRRLAVEAASRRALDRAKLGAEWQDDGFQHARDVLNILRRLPPATLNDPVQCHSLLQDVGVQYPQFTSIGFAERSTRIRCMNLPVNAMPFRDREVFDLAMAADPGAVVLGKFLIGPITGKPIVVIAEPLPPLGEEARPGIAFVSLDLDWAAHHAAPSGSIAEDTITLIDTREGKVLAGSPDQPHFAGRSLQGTALIRAMRENPKGGSIEASDIDQTQEIFGFAPLDNGPGMMVAVGLSRETVLAAANRRLLISIGGAILVSIAAAIAAWLFTHRTQVRAIRSLVGAARKLGAGDLTARARMEAWQAPEFRALSQTMNRMAIAIEAAQTNLKEREQQLRLLADHSTDMIIRVREGGKRLFVSPACHKLTGWEPDEMLRLSSQDMIHPADIAYVTDPRLFGETPFVFAYRMLHKEGHYLWVEGAARGLPTRPGEPRECIIVVRDIGQRVEAEQRLKESQARYRLLEEQGTDMIFQLDHDLTRRYVSPACQEILGYSPEELIGTKPVNMAHPDDAERVAKVFRSLLDGEVERTEVINRIRHRDGRWIWVEAQLRASPGDPAGAPSGITGSLRNITVRKAAEEQIEEANRRLAALARIDGLTGLANRRTFDEMLAREHSHAISDRSPLGLVLIDVDHFKRFNDRYGHIAGDECLRQVSRAIEKVLYHPSDVAARYGGEEFVVLLPGTDEAGAVKVAERLRQAILALNIEHADSSIGIVSISVGVASMSSYDPGRAVDTIVHEADRALYVAKNNGRNKVIGHSCVDKSVTDTRSWAA